VAVCVCVAWIGLPRQRKEEYYIKIHRVKSHTKNTTGTRSVFQVVWWSFSFSEYAVLEDYEGHVASFPFCYCRHRRG
jgi:hypothetical protein